MTRLLSVTAAAAVAAAFGVMFSSHSSATASTAGDPRVRVLQIQVRTLQSQVKALQSQVKTLRKAIDDQDGQIRVGFTADTCLAAQTADLVQGTWGVIDQIAQATQQKTYFGPQTQVNDFGNCGDLQGPDVPRGQVAIPPKIDPLVPLIQWLHE